MENVNSLQEFMGVKAMAEKGLDRVPHRFIRSLEERPKVSQDIVYEENENMPVIDLQEQVHDSPSCLSANLVEAIGRACHEWGCFQVVNHGTAPSSMDEMIEAAREFFELPEEQKTRYSSLDTMSSFRYASSFNLQKDKVLSWRDFIRYSCHPLEDVISLWPSSPPTFRKASVNFCTQIHRVLRKLCAAISQSLGLPENYIEQEFTDYSQIMVCNYYPKCPEPESTLGVGSHTDPGWITALMQDDVIGLQVLHRDRWVTVKPLPHALVVNVGDVLQILSNGLYKSVEHRATVNGSVERISVVTTYGPSLNTIIRPAPELLLKGCQPAYGQIVYKEYMEKILSGSLEDKRKFN
ncbi:hypothetical protein SUGI_1030330 [Cryptomeria japonica]|uniref:protein DMR6-LIKE OXYGENASE 2 n=1 Tax=Cryptomeria japonica TaxID=3369 RepID=UPI00241483EC|nr:protein DMR6-LIKE OXYGENASE 2 [Cryptomeria japonica]GLJ48856.1 hypothetical protein SUGI_1030330 [Cryptomeria japonica]